MDDASLIRLLAQFFVDEFREDAAGVGDWLAQGGQDADELVPRIQALADSES